MNFHASPFTGLQPGGPREESPTQSRDESARHKFKILIASAHRLAQAPWEALADQEPVTYATVSSAEDCLGALGREPFDLLIVDGLLPPVGGGTVLKALGRARWSPPVAAWNFGMGELDDLPVGSPPVLDLFAAAPRQADCAALLRRLEGKQLSASPSEDLSRTLDCLARMAEMADRMNLGHGRRVGQYAEMIGRAMGCSAARRLEYLWAGRLHDLGKVGVEDGVLDKPTSLTDQEMELVREHPAIGVDLLTPLAAHIPELLLAVRHHHERFDGGGYPSGLAGSEIPEIARVIAVADIFDSITSRRAYREPMPLDAAQEHLATTAGKQCDPQLVEALLRALQAIQPTPRAEPAAHELAAEGGTSS